MFELSRQTGLRRKPKGKKNKNLTDMETKETNLYKVYAKGWNSPAYVTAENQQEAVDKVAPYYETENPAYMNVEYVSHVIV